MARRTDPVHRVSGVRRPLSEDVQSRTRRYLVSMAIRTGCFIGAVVADGWLRWVLMAGAVFLPYIAVVVANAGRERIIEPPPTLLGDERPQLHAGPPRVRPAPCSRLDRDMNPCHHGLLAGDVLGDPGTRCRAASPVAVRHRPCPAPCAPRRR